MGIKMLLWLLLVLPWVTLVFLDKDTVKRYMPVTIFTCLLMTIIFQIAYTFKWWTIYQYIVPWGYMIDVSFAYGIFAVRTLWIFHLTSHKFCLYVITNVVIDAFFAFIALAIMLPSFGIGAYNLLQPWQYFLVIFALFFIIYGFHIWQQGIFKAPEERHTEGESGGELKIRGSIRPRAKAR
ncbi:hypothetical protein Alches_12730 [Alicyclobacillus hesperidum subsp. aegles]|uniref:Uncharacterized protein n=2 Tax=Alicyclobacillus TaxID=29330 RepID=A0AA37X4D1_9BACL|nr:MULTISPECIES: hypothetical protein [Alicyclobacillus]GLG01234.1 hypothetical protein Alches_12730 [Alicyclobacillus hesperidum subsp. aegles]GLV14692.1 hypothetical protein Heshes_23760 [Alicyclobacillus hesperidum]SHJ99941.1 hypothetical protein SAMN05443507_1072 [Alicyclobacillus montanus]